MSHILKDGTGKGYAAGVDSKNRLESKSTTVQDTVSITLNEGGYFCTLTEVIELTDDTESAISFIKTLEDSDLLVSRFTIALSESTGGSSPVTIKQYINPTAGSIITNAVDGLCANKVVGSPETLDALFYQGVQGDDFTTFGGFFSDIMEAGGRLTIDYRTILSKGNSLGLTITPPTGNTSMKVIFSVELFKLDEL